MELAHGIRLAQGFWARVCDRVGDTSTYIRFIHSASSAQIAAWQFGFQVQGGPEGERTTRDILLLPLPFSGLPFLFFLATLLSISSAISSE